MAVGPPFLGDVSGAGRGAQGPTDCLPCALVQNSPNNISGISNPPGTPRDDGELGGNFLHSFQNDNVSLGVRMGALHPFCSPFSCLQAALRQKVEEEERRGADMGGSELGFSQGRETWGMEVRRLWERLPWDGSQLGHAAPLPPSPLPTAVGNRWGSSRVIGGEGETCSLLAVLGMGTGASPAFTILALHTCIQLNCFICSIASYPILLWLFPLWKGNLQSRLYPDKGVSTILSLSDLFAPIPLPYSFPEPQPHSSVSSPLGAARCSGLALTKALSLLQYSPSMTMSV